MNGNGNHLEETYDVVVVGAGHAGCEAALACARLGLETILFTVSIDSVALMPCNPNIGGSSKGHLVREVDALGGEMGKAIDRTFIQSKMLNRSKGPAVHSLRAQADKAAYSRQMRQTLEQTEHLWLKQMEVTGILTEEDLKDSELAGEIPVKEEEAGQAGTEKIPVKEKCLVQDERGKDSFKKPGAGTDMDLSMEEEGVSLQGEKMENTHNAQHVLCRTRIVGVRTISGAIYRCRACVLCTGTYLKARCIYGDVSMYTGPNGLQAANHLSASLLSHGLSLRRFKTGTPARMDGRTIDYSRMEEQTGDERVVPFSFETDPESVQIEQVSCWLTYTNEETHRIIRENLDRSPLFSGMIEGTGPRYCPSIEDKVVRFADKEHHQVFLEPEGLSTNEMYVGGMSSSLPEDVQQAMYRTVPGLEHARIVKNAYAIEYDCIDPGQLHATLECKSIRGLFCGGQLNGSSGYEEAAAQGILAGINAAMYVKGQEPLTIDRSEGYLGVLVDDLVTKENHEPYRMMTSRAEYRLLLRQDNADLRLTEKGYRVGLIPQERYERLVTKRAQIEKETRRVEHTMIGANAAVQAFLQEHGSPAMKTSASLAELIRRPELDYSLLAPIDPDRPELPGAVQEQVNINIKYDGYIRRQEKQVEQFRRMESRKIPDSLDYDDVPSLRLEARQKLKQIRPASIGQASRISGVSPADISVLLVYLHANR